MKNIWFISGLGADERAFQNLDVSGWNPNFVHWSPPETKDTIADYAQRLLPQITNAKPILIGYSFGGMVAVELAKMMEIEKIIIVSSAKNRKELPPWYRTAADIPVYRLLPPDWIKRPMALYYYLFGVSKPKEKMLLAAIIRDTDPDFLSWAMRAITNWQNEKSPSNLLHIHGTSDRVLPYRYVQADFSIADGGHFMLVNRAAEISKLLHQLIDEPSINRNQE